MKPRHVVLPSAPKFPFPAQLPLYINRHSLTHLESTLPHLFIPLDFISPRINTYKKPGGRVRLWLTNSRPLLPPKLSLPLVGPPLVTSLLHVFLTAPAPPSLLAFPHLSASLLPCLPASLSVTRLPAVALPCAWDPRPLELSTFNCRLSTPHHSSPLFSHCSALFCTCEKVIPFLFISLRTLSAKHRGWGPRRTAAGLKPGAYKDKTFC
jgi:hypothetical protein